MKLQRFHKSSFLFMATFLSLSLYGQNPILDSLKNRSEIVVHIKVLEIIASGDWDVGATEIKIKAEVKTIYKGNLENKKVFYFVVISHVDGYKWDRMYNDSEYIVFLKKEYWTIWPEEASKIPTLTLTDRLLGIQPYFKELHNQLLLH